MNANIKTSQQAFWWAITTITTVGYGDHYPVTTGGKIFAGILMFCGIGFFSSLATVISSWLIHMVRRDEEEQRGEAAHADSSVRSGKSYAKN